MPFRQCCQFLIQHRQPIIWFGDVVIRVRPLRIDCRLAQNPSIAEILGFSSGPNGCPIQPSTDRSRRTNDSGFPSQDDEDRLKRVLGILNVLQYPLAHAKNHRPMSLSKVLKRGLAALDYKSRNEVGIGRLRRGGHSSEMIHYHRQTSFGHAFPRAAPGPATNAMPGLWLARPSIS